jgi:quinol monooxygenase YgiN
MTLAIIKIYPTPEANRASIEVLESLKCQLAANVDCLGCSVAVETDEAGAVCYTEEWRTREALDRHLRSSLYGRVLEAMEFSRLPPVVLFYEVKDVGGLELIELARTSGDAMEWS